MDVNTNLENLLVLWKALKVKKKKSVSYSFAVAYEDVIIIHARVVVYYKIVLDQSD